MSEPIIIETPAPPTRERLVLVPPESVSIVRENGTVIGLSIRANDARDATPADLERGGYGKLPMWVTSAADGQKLIGERDEARAAFLGCAQAIGIVCQADGHADEPGPPAAVIAAIKELAKRVEDLESELATANEWRERWCRESEAAAVQSNANWQRAKDLEARAEKAEGLLIQRETELRLAREDGDERARDLRQAYERAMAAAEKAERELATERYEHGSTLTSRDMIHNKLAQAERERDEAKAGHNAVQPRVYALEADLAETVHERDSLRAELARLTAPGEGSEGEPTDEELRAVHGRACGGATADGDTRALCIARRALWRAGVAHERAKGHSVGCKCGRRSPATKDEDATIDAAQDAGWQVDGVNDCTEDMCPKCQRARQQPEKDRATDEELAEVYRKVYETHGGRTIDVSHDDCRRAAVGAVAARVRQERCLVAQAVAADCDIHVTEQISGMWCVRVVAQTSSTAAGVSATVPRAEVPSTLARLLVEVSRG